MACECNYDWCAWPNITGTSDNLCPHHSHRLAIEYKRQKVEIERLREFCLRAHRGLAGKKYDPDLFDALAREAKKAAEAKGE